MDPKESNMYYSVQKQIDDAQNAQWKKKHNQAVYKELRIIEKAIGSTDIRDISRALTSIWKLKQLFIGPSK